MPRPRFCGKAKRAGKRKYGFPLWGKLSPQVTDEGAAAGHFPLIRRAGAPPSPKGGRLFSTHAASRPTMQPNGLRLKNAGAGSPRPTLFFIFYLLSFIYKKKPPQGGFFLFLHLLQQLLHRFGVTAAVVAYRGRAHAVVGGDAAVLQGVGKGQIQHIPQAPG